MLKIAIATLLLFALSCSTRTVYIKPKPYHLQKTDTLPALDIRVYKPDRHIFEAYIDACEESIDFHNEQIDLYFKSFEEE